MCSGSELVEARPINTDGGTERDLFLWPDGADRSHIDMFDRLTECLTWIEAGHCWILSRDEGGGLVQLRLRTAQRRIMAEMMHQAATCPRCGKQTYGYGPMRWTCEPCTAETGKPVYRGVPIRIIITKARKEGVTTLSMAIQVFFVQHYPYQNALMVAHEKDATKEIFDGALRIHTAGESDRDSGGRPKYIREPHGSTFRANTGAGAFVGTGGNKTIVHISELAKITTMRHGEPMDEELLHSIKNSVPMEPWTIVIIESTGMGPRGEFYRRCDYLRKNQGTANADEMGFRLLFFPWWEDDDYRLDLPLDFKTTPYEERIRAQVEAEHGIRLDDEQLYWYRRKRAEEQIDEDSGLGEAKFRREYPSVFDDCFSAVEGRVYPNFSTGPRHMREIDLSPWYRLIEEAPKDHRGVVTDWEFSAERGMFRAMDVGYHGRHLWVVVWGVYDNSRAPSFSINPNDHGCLMLRDEFLGYVWDKMSDRPVKDESDHGPSAVRYAVTHLKACGLVHIFKAQYYKDAADLPSGAMETVARDMHEAARWRQPEGADYRRLDLYQPDSGSLQFTREICDPRAADALDQFPRWGIPLQPADTRPPKSHITNRTVEKEVNWGVSRLAKLINGSSFFDAQQDGPTTDELVEQAEKASKGIGTPFGRPSAPTAEQRKAMEQKRAEALYDGTIGVF